MAVVHLAITSQRISSDGACEVISVCRDAPTRGTKQESSKKAASQLPVDDSNVITMPSE